MEELGRATQGIHDHDDKTLLRAWRQEASEKQKLTLAMLRRLYPCLIAKITSISTQQIAGDVLMNLATGTDRLPKNEHHEIPTRKR